jgi:hypothetical protein
MGLRFRIGAIVLAVSIGTSACAGNPMNLPTPARNFYFVIEDEAQQSEYLKLKDSERQAFLEDLGLWQKWLELSNQEREAVELGEVQVGFKEFAAHMAWGLPASIQLAEAGEREVRYETFLRCTSGPRKGEYVRNNLDCDGTSSEIQLAIENSTVTEIKYRD